MEAIIFFHLGDDDVPVTYLEMQAEAIVEELWQHGVVAEVTAVVVLDTSGVE